MENKDFATHFYEDFLKKKELIVKSREEQKKELMEMINKTNFRELFRSSNKEYFIQ